WWLELPLLDELPVIGLLIALAFVIFLVIPALIFVVELLLFLAVGSVLVLVNSMFRRPWIVEAVRERPERRVLRWRVVGLLRSRRVIAEVAEALRSGQRHIEVHDAELVEQP